jgi:hypothetical protein
MSTSFLASQYAAIHFSHDASSGDYYDAVIANCQTASQIDTYLNGSFCENLRGIGYVINYNFSAVHVTPVYQALADQSIIREAMNDDAYTISATIHPLSIAFRENAYGQSEDAFLAWFLLVLSFPFIVGTFGTFIVAERLSKAKHLQTLRA